MEIVENSQSVKNWLKLVKKEKVIAVIRNHDYDVARNMAIAVALGGIKLIEITENSDRPWQLISQLKSELPDCSIGTGTILNQNQLQEAIVAGAEFIFTPHVDEKLIKMAITAQIPIVPGALSPTEIITAWQCGATCVKVFPIMAIGGVEYLKALKSPIGHIPLIPTGGVNLQNAASLLNAGAIAVGLGGDLFPPEMVVSKNWENITLQAKKLLLNLN